jgi:fibronectin type III domain protein
MLHCLYVHGSYIAFLIRSILGILLVAGTVGCGSGGDEGGTKTLSWTAVPDPSVLGYKAYWGTSSHHYESNTDVGANTSYTISGLQHGSRYFFAVSAYNADGESGLSAEVSAVVE